MAKLRDVQTGDILTDKDGKHCKVLYVGESGLARNKWQGNGYACGIRAVKTDDTIKRVYGSLRHFLDSAVPRKWKIKSSTGTSDSTKVSVTMQELADKLDCSVEDLEIVES